MTAKERRYVKRLETRIEELERQHWKEMDVYRDNVDEIIEMRTALRNIHDALIDAVNEINSVIRPIDRISARLTVEAGE